MERFKDQSIHDSKTVTPSPLKEDNSYSAVNTRCESVDKGVKKPPLPVLGQAPPSFQENGCQLIEGGACPSTGRGGFLKPLSTLSTSAWY